MKTIVLLNRIWMALKRAAANETTKATPTPTITASWKDKRATNPKHRKTIVFFEMP